MKHKEQYSFAVLPDHSADVDDRHCQWLGCAEGGDHRAPRARDRLNEYHWFCLDHVRIYNRSWNYYEGMSDGEVEALVRSDTTWNRPSWPFSGVPEDGRQADETGYDYSRIHDPFGFLNTEEIDGNGKTKAPSELSSTDRQALDRLGLNFPVTIEEVKTRYKILVKKHHPDANGGDKTAEEKFKRINAAYEILMNGLVA